MTTSIRISALDIASVISERIGSYVDMNFIQFLAVEGDRIRCWYMNGDGEGPSFDIEMQHTDQGWRLSLTELPPGTYQEIEVP